MSYFCINLLFKNQTKFGISLSTSMCLIIYREKRNFDHKKIDF